MKNIIYITLLSLITIMISCTNDEVDKPTIVNTQDYTVDIRDNVKTGDTIVTVLARSNKGSLSYNIINQNPVDAFAIDPDYGQITVNDETLIDAINTPVIDIEVSVGKDEVIKTSNVTINVASGPVCNNLDVSFFDNKTFLITSQDLPPGQGPVNMATTLSTDSSCATVTLRSEDMFLRGCMFQQDVDFILTPFPGAPEEIGEIRIEQRLHECFPPFFNFEISGVGTYDMFEGTIVATITYTFDNGAFTEEETIIFEVL